MKDYYEILQVSPNAEPEVIASAYRRLARKYHPDAYAGPDATERMRELNEAYEVLSDPARRAEYDRARGYERQEARRAERETPPGPQGAPAEPARTPTAEPARRRPILVVLGLLGLAALGTSLAIGVWIGVDQAGNGDDTSSRGTTGGPSRTSSPATPAAAATLIAPDFGAFAKGWWHHGFVLSIDIDGQGIANWRVYKWCSDDPSPPCDRIEGDLLFSGGSATLVFSRIDGQTAIGRVTSSNDQTTFRLGSEVLLTLLPYDMASLIHNRYETILCGPDYAELAPESLRETLPCGA